LIVLDLPMPKEPEAQSSRSDIATLARMISAHAPYDGRFELRVPGVFAIRASHPSDVPLAARMKPAVCITAQGEKRVLLGEDVIDYTPATVTLYCVEVPIAAEITAATVAEPFLNLRIDLDPATVAKLATKVYRFGPPRAEDPRGVHVGPAEPKIVAAAIRLLEAMADPIDAELLGPAAVEEIIVRLLRTSMGSRLAQIGDVNSELQRMADAVAWLAENFAEPMNVRDLAKRVNLSVSSFHHHFKRVTALSPVQYQKALRLQEARRLMLTEQYDAASAARVVGYVSPSQFSREYAREFGSAPMKDILRLREARIRSPESTA
jgi:AraC-like DNA-binding protein